MPRSPKGEKRPADVNALAIMIGKIAAGENEDVTTDDGKNAAAVAFTGNGLRGVLFAADLCDFLYGRGAAFGHEFQRMFRWHGKTSSC
jgi:hypothetical protein